MMIPVEQLLADAIQTDTLNARLDTAAQKLTLYFKSGRSQSVMYEIRKERLRLISVVATKSQVDRFGSDEILHWCWQRNRFTDIAGFAIDRRGRLVGQIEHPIDTLDAAELAFYLQALAMECDRFEFVLSGMDQS
jgi:hypothetical protein